jgi:hypothetical protein
MLDANISNIEGWLRASGIDDTVPRADFDDFLFASCPLGSDVEPCPSYAHPAHPVSIHGCQGVAIDFNCRLSDMKHTAYSSKATNDRVITWTTTTPRYTETTSLGPDILEMQYATSRPFWVAHASRSRTSIVLTCQSGRSRTI